MSSSANPIFFADELHHPLQMLGLSLLLVILERGVSFAAQFAADRRLPMKGAFHLGKQQDIFTATQVAEVAISDDESGVEGVPVEVEASEPPLGTDKGSSLASSSSATIASAAFAAGSASVSACARSPS